MKLDVKSTAVALAVVWGGWAIFLTGVANLIWPDYGQSFLELMASVYPGYQATASFGPGAHRHAVWRSGWCGHRSRLRLALQFLREPPECVGVRVPIGSSVSLRARVPTDR